MSPKIAHPAIRSGRMVDVEQVMAEVEKGQQLAGHFPNATALERGRRVFLEEMTEDEAYSELDAKYRHG